MFLVIIEAVNWVRNGDAQSAEGADVHGCKTRDVAELGKWTGNTTAGAHISGNELICIATALTECKINGSVNRPD